MQAEWLAELRVLGERGAQNAQGLTAIRADIHLINAKLDLLAKTIAEAQTTLKVSVWFTTKLAAAAGVIGAFATSAVTYLWPGIHPK